MDDEDLYDEFGNYIGDDVVEDSDDEDVNLEAENVAEAYVQDDAPPQPNEKMDVDEEVPVVKENGHEGAIVLHEDKVYYPNASDVFGDDVEVMVQDRDTQSIAEPIIQPDVVKKFTFEQDSLPLVNFSRQFQVDLMQTPDQMRNIALVGHTGHGKTSILDMLVSQTHELREFTGILQNEQLRYTDIHVIERERGLTIFNSPMSLVLPSRKGKSRLMNIMDTPGHVDFIDEVVAAGRLVDGFIIVVDVVEGLAINTKRVLQHAINEQIPFTLVVNKVDRLIMELNIPPNDAYAKLVHCIEQVNDYLRYLSPTKRTKLAPELGNVIFASAKMEWCFSLQTFADKYAQRFPGLDSKEFAKRLWGDVFYNTETRKFTKNKQNNITVRSFVHFIMNPLYKLYSHAISKESEELAKLLKRFNIKLKKSDYKMDLKPLLKLICKEFFGEASAFVDMCVDHLPSPVEAAPTKILINYSGPIDNGNPLVESMNKCNQQGPLSVQITKLYNSSDASEFYALGRVMSGTLKRGQSVTVLGEQFTNEDQEDSSKEKVIDLWVPMTRYKMPIDNIPAGCWALIKGVDSRISKTAALLDKKVQLDDCFNFKPLKVLAKPFVKLAIEPLNPSELPRMLDGLRKVTKTFVLLQNIVEDSGEHTIFGSGELYMDCVMHDLRNLFANIEIKISDPSTKFNETCTQTTAIQCPSRSPNKANKLTILAEPLDDGISENIEQGRVDINWTVRQVGKFFQEQHGWDVFASRNIWAFGPDDMGPNMLVNDTLPDEVDRRAVNSVRDFIRNGFTWMCKEGPLCGEPVRNTKFRLFQADLSENPAMRAGGQIIPTTRRACHASFMLAAPRLLEPIYSCHITCADKAVQHVYNLFERRRGGIYQDTPIPGTPLSYVEGQVPVIDSFGLETDLRLAAGGSASVSLVFDRWQQVAGDPLDKDQHTRPLQSARGLALARDFVLKTRRRKGMGDGGPSITGYLDPDILEHLQALGALDL